MGVIDRRKASLGAKPSLNLWTFTLCNDFIYICGVPKIAVYKALIFYMVSFDLSERLHLHVFSKQKGRSRSAKIWLDDFSVFEPGQLTDNELATAQNLMKQNQNRYPN